MKKNSKLPMFRFLRLLVLCIMVIDLSAQQCNYQNLGAVLVSVMERETGNKIHGLKLSLVHEDGSPYQELSDSPKDNTICSEPYLFWENSSDDIPKKQCVLSRIIRRSFSNALDHYICVVPIKNNINALSLLAHGHPYSAAYILDRKTGNLSSRYFLYLKIEDTDGRKNGGEFATQIFKIPAKAVIDICASHLDGQRGKLNQGFKLNPIRVFLFANSKKKVLPEFHTGFSNYVVPVYEESEFDQGLPPSVLKLASVQVFNEYTEKNQQLLYPPQPQQEGKLWGKGALEILTWQHEYIRNNQVFRIPAEKKKSQINLPFDPFIYYRLHPKFKVYEIDTLLNNKDYVMFNNQTKVITAKHWEERDNKLIETIYRLEDSKWVIIEEKKYPLPSNEKGAPPEGMPLCSIQLPLRDKPLQFFDNEKTKQIRDTFWISNQGNKTASLTCSSMFYTVPKRIEPGQTLPIIYQRQFEVETDPRPRSGYVQSPMQQVGDACIISYNNKTVSCQINYLILKETAVKQITDSITQFEIPLGNDTRFKVFVNKEGYVTEFGSELYTGCKVGIWRRTDKALTAAGDEQFNKVLQVILLNDTLSECSVSLVNAWSMVEFSKGEVPSLFCIPRNAIELVISKGESSVRYKIDFENMAQKHVVQLYLLKPNETYYYENKVRIPIDFSHQQFHIRWTTTFLETTRMRGDRPDSILGMYFNSWKKDFPNIVFKRLSNRYVGDDTRFTLDLSQCTPSERVTIKKRIEKDKNILNANLSLRADRDFFCDQSILVYNSKNSALSDEFKQLAEQVGFTYNSTQASSNLIHFFKYKSKIIDESFFEAYNYLCERSGLQEVHLNHYGYQQIDHKDILPYD